MNRYIILLIAIFVISFPTIAEAKIEGYEIVASSDKENITLYAKRIKDVYRDFKIEFKGGILSRPYWLNDTNLTWSPQINYEDVNQNQKKELIIILTKGQGTGVLEQQAHVFHIEEKGVDNALVNIPVEVIIDDPISIIMKNVNTKLTAKKAKITIGGERYTIDIKKLDIKLEHLFKDIYFGNIIKFEVIENQLIAKVAGEISPAGYIGEIVIVYDYRDKMYQAKSIKFEQY